MNITTIKTTLGIIIAAGTIGGSGVWLATTYATNEELQQVSSKADIAISEHIRYLLTEIARLESKLKAGKGTQYDRDQVESLEQMFHSLKLLQT